MAASNKRSTADDFEFLSRLGSGSFGTVFKVRRIEDDGVYVIKVVRIGELTAKEKAEAINEVRLLARIDNGFIVRYHDSFIDQESLHIVMEYCNRGDLSLLLLKAKEKEVQSLKEDLTWNISLQVILGLYCLHEQKILHRDLKTANVFLQKDNSQRYFAVKIGDLGVAKLLETSTAFAQTIVGTPYYLSPELCADQPYRDRSDCWALGIILYECCTLTRPFTAGNQCALIMKIIQAQVEPVSDSHASSELSALITWLLQKDWRHRPTTKELLCEQFIRHKLDEHGLELPEELLYEQTTSYLSFFQGLGTGGEDGGAGGAGGGDVAVTEICNADLGKRAGGVFPSSKSTPRANTKPESKRSRVSIPLVSTTLGGLAAAGDHNHNNLNVSDKAPVRGDRVRGRRVRQTSMKVQTRHQIKPEVGVGGFNNGAGAGAGGLGGVGAPSTLSVLGTPLAPRRGRAEDTDKATVHSFNASMKGIDGVGGGSGGGGAGAGAESGDEGKQHDTDECDGRFAEDKGRSPRRHAHPDADADADADAKFPHEAKSDSPTYDADAKVPFPSSWSPPEVVPPSLHSTTGTTVSPPQHYEEDFEDYYDEYDDEYGDQGDEWEGVNTGGGHSDGGCAGVRKSEDDSALYQTARSAAALEVRTSAGPDSPDPSLQQEVTIPRLLITPLWAIRDPPSSSRREQSARLCLGNASEEDEAFPPPSSRSVLSAIVPGPVALGGVATTSPDDDEDDEAQCCLAREKERIRTMQHWIDDIRRSMFDTLGPSLFDSVYLIVQKNVVSNKTFMTGLDETDGYLRDIHAQLNERLQTSFAAASRVVLQLKTLISLEAECESGVRVFLER